MTPLYPALGAAREIASATPPSEVKPFELGEITIADLQDGMKSGKFTARSLVEKYSARIEEIDKQGPTINSVIELNPDALSIADSLDQERKAKGPRGPLHGIPVLIKDNIDTADKMMTTAGSLALVGSKPPQGFFRGTKAARRGRRHPGQNKSQRVGQHSLQPLHQRMERPRRPDQKSLRAGSQSLRLEFRHRRGHIGQSVRCRNRHGNRWFDRLPLLLERPRRHQAHGGSGQSRRHHSDLS